MNKQKSETISEDRIRELVEETATMTADGESKKQKTLKTIMVHYGKGGKKFNSWLNEEGEIINKKKINRGLNGYEMAVLVMRKISKEINETLDF